MIEAKADLIRNTVVDQTGAAITLDTGPAGVQKGLELRFSDLTRNEGPIVTLRPSGLKRHLVTVGFGNFSASIIRQIAQATDEQVEVARALLKSVSDKATLSFPKRMSLESWEISSPAFTLHAERKVQGDRQSDESITETCETIVVPIMAALAELIGYEETPAPSFKDFNGEFEGTVGISTVLRRERNPRNRLLCIHIHGHQCAVCGIDPRATYGMAHGAVLEVHHLQPLSSLNEPRIYDPQTDLVPLCPNCHRVVHTKRPVPWSISQVMEMMNE